MEGSNEKNGEETEGRTSIVKCGEMLLEWKSRGLWKSFVGLSICDEAVKYIWVNI